MRQLAVGRTLTMGLLGAAAMVAVAAPASASTESRSEPVVTGGVQVTGDPSVIRAHTSPQLARNPKTGELVIVEGDIRGTRRCTVHISANDGRSWAAGGDPLEQPFTDCSFHADWGPYATIAFDKDGLLYMAIEASDPKFFNASRNDAPRHIFLARSEDSGRTWETNRVFEAPDGSGDLGTNKGATVAVDPKNPKFVYVGWRQGLQSSTEKLKTNVAASADGGRTWTKPAEISDERGGDFPWMTVTPDGVLHVVSWTRVFPAPPTGQPNPVRPIYHRASSDHGRTFGDRHQVDPGNQQHEHPPQVVSDPKTGALYVTWAGQPDALNQAAGYSSDLEIFFRSSTDGGKTWSERKTLNDDGRGKANQIDPGMSVAPNGRIDVAWYDGRLSPAPLGNRTENGFNDVYYTYSTDGGKTWVRNLRISDRSADRSIGVWANNVDQRLNVGIASARNGAYFAWQDTRNANRDFQPEDVYTASVKLGEEPASEGSSGTPPWLAAGTGLAVGMGLAMLVAWARTRRPGPGPGRAAPAPA